MEARLSFLVTIFALGAASFGVASIVQADDLRTFSPVLGVRPHRDRVLKTGPELVIEVRAIQGRDPLEDGAFIEREIDPVLGDIAMKLRSLPYRSFSQIMSQQREMSLTKKEVFSLPLGQTLVIRPMQANTGQVVMWLRWRDRVGSTILDTKMAFTPDDILVTGTNCPHNKGLVIAVRVSGQKLPTP